MCKRVFITINKNTEPESNPNQDLCLANCLPAATKPYSTGIDHSNLKSEGNILKKHLIAMLKDRQNSDLCDF